MQQTISKSEFKAHALAIMRDIEKTGDHVVITTHGKPTLIVSPFITKTQPPLDKLRGSVVSYKSPTLPVSDDDWDCA